jgi:hypothetical protein
VSCRRGNKLDPIDAIRKNAQNLFIREYAAYAKKLKKIVKEQRKERPKDLLTEDLEYIHTEPGIN